LALWVGEDGRKYSDYRIITFICNVASGAGRMVRIAVGSVIGLGLARRLKRYGTCGVTWDLQRWKRLWKGE